jgi:beta-glucosidase-like glycosyl hydrolase
MKALNARTIAVSSAVLLACASLFGQSGDFVTSGKVVDTLGQPISWATITYTSIGQRLSWDFSRGDGTYGTYVSATKPWTPPQNAKLNIAAQGPVSIEIFDINGKKIGSVFNANIDKGTYELEPVASKLSPSVYLLKIKAGGQLSYQKLLNTGMKTASAGVYSFSSPTSHSATIVAKTILATIDTVRIGKTGYTPKLRPISAYASALGTDTLHSIDIEGQVNAKYAQLTNASDREGQCQMPHVNTSFGTNVGSFFGGGGEFSGFTPTTSANYCDGKQNANMGAGYKIPLLVSYDGVHGMDVMSGGSILPHNMGMAAIQDSTIFEKAERVAALEMRGTGCNWTFGPCIATIRDDRWGREYEGFSETPELTSKCARWAVRGLQLTDLSHPWVVCVASKHFAGDGGTTNGTNGGQTAGPVATAAALHLPTYTAAISAGTGSVMPSFSSWADGTEMHCNTTLLTNWLKNGTAYQGVAGNTFDGIVVGDWAGTDVCGGITQGMAAGVDVPMVASGIAAIPDNARTNDACKRVLRIKYRMNLFNQYLTPSALTSNVGCAAHRDAVRAAVRASLVLLKNGNSALPIPKGSNVAIWGQGGNDVGIQCGGWTVSWQGSTGTPTPGTTIYAGVQSVNTGGTTTFTSGGSTTPGSAGYIIAVISENPYAETDFTDISPTAGAHYTSTNTNVINDINAVKPLYPNVKIIVVMMAGRALSVSSFINNCDAFVWASLPGTEGLGIAQVLFNDQGYHFTGKLPVTWPTSVSQEPINYGDGQTGQYAYQAGLSPY